MILLVRTLTTNSTAYRVHLLVLLPPGHRGHASSEGGSDLYGRQHCGSDLYGRRCSDLSG